MDCWLAAIVLAFIVGLILLIYGFVLIFSGPGEGEDELEVIQRQLKGFALLILAPIVVVAIIFLYRI